MKENIVQPSSEGNNIVQNSYKEDFVQPSKKVAGSADLNFRQNDKKRGKSVKIIFIL